MTDRAAGDGGSSAARSVRAIRYRLYLIGGVWIAVALVLDLLPALRGMASPLAIRLCALVALVFFVVGRFSPDAVLMRLRGGRPQD